MFQFLIGTIKTIQARLHPGESVGVSIPHRYDQNYTGKWLLRLLYDVSIPHRYDQIFAFALNMKTISLFQFLIGTIKTQAPDRSNGNGRLVVSIPHRYDQNQKLLWRD